MKKTLLLRWTKSPETDVLYLLKNLTEEQYATFIKAEGRMVNDSEEDPTWDEHNELQALMIYMGKLEENFDYGKAQSLNDKNIEYKTEDCQPNYTQEEIDSFLEEIQDFGGGYDEEQWEDDRIEKFIEDKKKEFNTECISSGWYL